MRWRRKNRSELSSSNLGTARWSPELACRLFCVEARASNRARPDSRGTSASSHCSRNSTGIVTRAAASVSVSCAEAAEDGGADPRLGRRQRQADRGAERHAPVAHRPAIGLAGVLAQGVEDRLPLGDRPGRQFGVVTGDVRADRLAGRHQLPQPRDEAFVLLRPRPIAVAGGVDADRREAAAGRVPAATGDHARRLLVLAAAVAEQDQRPGAVGVGGRPEHAGDAVEDEEPFRDAVSGRLRDEVHGCVAFRVCACGHSHGRPRSAET